MARSSRITQAQFQSVNNKDNQEHQISQQLIDSFIEGEDFKIKESAMQSDIQKLIKAVVAQRKYIETLEDEKKESTKLITTLQNDKKN